MAKLLVVDDERDVCEFIKNFFGERGFKVFTASNGKEALEIVKKETPLIVLLDIRMPGIDGIETLRLIKEKRPEDKVIMVTCVDDMDKMEQAKKYGADTYITKPLVLEELVRAVMGKMPERDTD